MVALGDTSYDERDLATLVETWFTRKARTLTNPEAAAIGRTIGILRKGLAVPTGETQKAIDRFVKAYDTGRLRADLVEDLEAEPFSRFEEWASSLSEVAEAIDTAKDAIEVWRDEEDRELRADDKEAALEALETLSVWDASPLDLSKLCDSGLLEDWEPEDDG